MVTYGYNNDICTMNDYVSIDILLFIIASKVSLSRLDGHIKIQ